MKSKILQGFLIGFVIVMFSQDLRSNDEAAEAIIEKYFHPVRAGSVVDGTFYYWHGMGGTFFKARIAIVGDKFAYYDTVSSPNLAQTMTGVFGLREILITKKAECFDSGDGSESHDWRAVPVKKAIHRIRVYKAYLLEKPEEWRDDVDPLSELAFSKKPTDIQVLAIRGGPLNGFYWSIPREPIDPSILGSICDTVP